MRVSEVIVVNRHEIIVGLYTLIQALRPGSGESVNLSHTAIHLLSITTTKIMTSSGYGPL